MKYSVFRIFPRRVRLVALLVALGLGLVGCKADQVELQVDATQLRSAAAGNEVAVEFRAVFTDPRPLSTRQSALVDDVWRVVRDVIDTSGFTRESADGGLRVTIEGEIPVRTSPSPDDVYYLSLTESDAFPGMHRVTLQTAEGFEALRQALATVDFELDLAAHHPTVIELSGRAGRLMAPAALIDGDAHLAYSAPLEAPLERPLRIRQSGAVIEQTGPGFFIRLTD